MAEPMDLWARAVAACIRDAPPDVAGDIVLGLVDRVSAIAGELAAADGLCTANDRAVVEAWVKEVLEQDRELPGTEARARRVVDALVERGALRVVDPVAVRMRDRDETGDQCDHRSN